MFPGSNVSPKPLLPVVVRCQKRLLLIVLKWVFGAEEAGTVGNRWNKSDAELISSRPPPHFSIFIFVFLYFCISVFLYFCIHVFLYSCISVLMYFCISVFLYFCILVRWNKSDAELISCRAPSQKREAAEQVESRKSAKKSQNQQIGWEDKIMRKSAKSLKTSKFQITMENQHPHAAQVQKV